MYFFMFLKFKFFGIMPKFQEFSNLLKVAKPPFKNIHKSFFLSWGGTVNRRSRWRGGGDRGRYILNFEEKVRLILSKKVVTDNC